ncbi:DUF4241 domain-containing protein [Kitasatospora sp. NPDC047058]|uniref:DUF4241 domain-containing protein n=1 Tax=Kitasatospora sp. NPDC047058 TaxID=3155620 RepID=UPI0033E87B5E
MDLAAEARSAADAEESWYLEAAFIPGTRLGTRCGDPATPVRVTEVRDVATIRVPSGRLVVDAPWPEEEVSDLRPRTGRELAQRIPAGTFRMEAAWTEAPYEFMGERFDGRELAAVRLRITEAPVAHWEMALGVGEDIERIRPGKRTGFETETNMGSFADATAWPVLTDPFLEFWRGCQTGNRQPRRTESLFDGEFERVADDEHGADLVTFGAEGSSVVWLGRSQTGAVASVAVASGYHLFVREPSI